MDEHVATLCITVVGDKETGREDARGIGIGGRPWEGVESFEELNRFRSGGGTEIENLRRGGGQ